MSLWDETEDLDRFLLPTEDEREVEAAERRAIQLGADLLSLQQMQPGWTVFCAWMRSRANQIARAALRGDGSDHSRDWWQGRLEECEGILTDLQRVIDEGRRVEGVHLELAAKVRGAISPSEP